MSRAPLPEARDSHVAAVIEINRAIAYSAKAASKERRRAKKIAKAKRKVAEKARERMTSAATSEPVSVGTRCYGSPLPDEVRNAMRKACNEHGLLAVYNLIHYVAPRRTRDAVVSAMVYVRDDRPSGRVHPFAKSWQYDFATAARVLSNGGMPTPPKSENEIQWPPSVRRVGDTEPGPQQPLGVEERTSEDDPRFIRIHDEVDNLREEMAKINANLLLLVGKSHHATPPPERSARDRLGAFMRGVCKTEDDFELKWSELYSVAQSRWGIPWRKIAADVGHCDFEVAGWRLDIAVASGRIDSLLEIAHELFGNG